MIGQIVSQTTDGAAVHAYLSHDRREPGQPRPESAERVAWVETLESPTDDPDETLRLMERVIAQREVLKRRAGVTARGRKVKTTFLHGVLSFAAHERPPLEEQRAAARSWLKALGLDERMAIAYAHTDGRVVHVHLLVCKIDPYTGRAVDLGRSKLRLSRWAHQWEVDHGGVIIATRVEREKQRRAFAAALAKEMKDFRASGRTKRERSAERRQAREAATERLRNTGAHRMTPRQPTRGAGRDDRTPEEKAAWRRMFESPEYRALSRPEQKAANRDLKARLDALRKERAAAEPARPEPPVPDVPPSAPPPAAVEATPDVPPAVPDAMRPGADVAPPPDAEPPAAEVEAVPDVPPPQPDVAADVAAAARRVARWSQSRGAPSDAAVAALTAELRKGGSAADVFGADAIDEWHRQRPKSQVSDSVAWMQESAALIEMLRDAHAKFNEVPPAPPQMPTAVAGGSGPDRAGPTRGRGGRGRW